MNKVQFEEARKAMERPPRLQELNSQLKYSFLRWDFGGLIRCTWPKAFLVDPKALLVQALSCVLQTAGLDLPHKGGSSEFAEVPEQAASLDCLSGSYFLPLSENLTTEDPGISSWTPACSCHA